MMDSTLHYTSVSHSGALMATINKMRVNSDLCDVTVVVGEYRIMAHRIILSASAPFFYQMLQLHSQPHQENNEVQLNNIDEIAALKIIEFCYTSAISLDDDTVWPLLAASIKFQLPEICSFCCEFLVAGLDTSNCILSLRLAAKVHCPQLEENCVRYLLENIDQACVSPGLNSLSTPELYSLLSVLALHDVGPATMAKLVSMWMDVDRVIRQDRVFSQFLEVFPNMAPYLHQFSMQNVSGKSSRGADSSEERGYQMKEGFEFNKDNGKLSSNESFDLGKRTSLKTNFDITDKGRSLQNQEEEEAEDSSSKGKSGFGIGASREFICISCGDDFDCDEELVSHQNECDESARMVGSASGDSLREGLMGRKKVGDDGNGDGKNEQKEEEMVDSCQSTRDTTVRKRKLDGNEISLDTVSSDSKFCKVALSSQSDRLSDDKNPVGSGSGDEVVSEQGEGIDTGVNKSLDVEGKGTFLSRTVENAQENLSPSVRSNCTEIYEPERNGEEEDVVCTNDDNNNAIGGGGEGCQKEEKSDQREEDGDSISNLDVVSSNTAESESNFGKCSSFPDILSSSSTVNSTESHFKTRKSSDAQGWQGKNRYSSSSAGLSSSINKSSSSSLQNLRPQQRCQICGRSFWEKKQLSQHWVLDHGVKTHKSTTENNNEGEQGLSPPHHQSKLLQPLSKLSPDREVQSNMMSTPANSWPFSNNYLGQGPVVDSMFKSGSAFQNAQMNGWESIIRRAHRNTNSEKTQADLHSKMATEGDLLAEDEKNIISVNRKRQRNLDRLLMDKFTPDQNSKPREVSDMSREGEQNARSSPLSLVKQERFTNNAAGSNLDNDPKIPSLLPSGNFFSPGSHSLGSNDFLTNYLNQYNKTLAQWCLAQGPNFCPACLVHHTNGSPCPRSQSGLSMEKSVLYTAKPVSDNLSMDKNGKVKEEKEDAEEEDKEVNVDGVDEELEEGPLDMSKSSLEFSANTNLSSLSSTSSTSQFISPGTGHLLPRPPSSSSSSTVLGFPPYYNYSHFLSGNSLMDMSAATAAALKAAGGSFGDLIPRQSPVQDLTSAVQSRAGRDQPQQHNYNSYLHHHALSASAIAAQTSMASNSNINNNNGTLASAAFSSAIARTHNGLNGGAGLVSSNDISSASSPSSIFSFPSSPPNTNAASASSSSHIPHPSTSGGKKKSATAPPKQGFPCTVCNRVYSHQSALLTHMRSHSPSTRSYRCQFCNETFARAPDLKVHVCPNGIEKPFTCPSCGQTFAKNIHLKRHLATHSGLKPYPCWVCGKRFSRSDHLKRHTQSIHAGARPHACHICGKEFVRKYELNKHMTIHN